MSFCNLNTNTNSACLQRRVNQAIMTDKHGHQQVSYIMATTTNYWQSFWLFPKSVMALLSSNNFVLAPHATQVHVICIKLQIGQLAETLTVKQVHAILLMLRPLSHMDITSQLALTNSPREAKWLLRTIIVYGRSTAITRFDGSSGRSLVLHTVAHSQSAAHNLVVSVISNCSTAVQHLHPSFLLKVQPLITLPCTHACQAFQPI